MSGKKARSRAPLWRAAAIVEVIVCYMAILAVISYARGPERWQTVDPPVLESGAFTSFAGETAGENGLLPMENGSDGQAVGWQAELELEGVDALFVSFHLDCPEQYAGGTLFVDLYNHEAGYDSPEQEYALRLTPGEVETRCLLEPGEGRPDKARLRLFTLDMAGYDVKDLLVCRGEPGPKVPGGLWVGAAVCVLLLAGTAAAWAVSRNRTIRELEEDGQ